MGKYLTRRCIGLHVVTFLLVSSFLLATWWQYEAAESGNGLSWAYVFEWPAFAIYAVYMWWKLIHDKHTPFDRLWAARQRSGADALGTPLYQIPGWALDKTLYREVVATSIAAAHSLELSDGQTEAIAPPELGHGLTGEPSHLVRAEGDETREDDSDERVRGVIDAQVIDVKVHTDEELNVYNRYLAQLNWSDPPKHWGTRWRARRGGTNEQSGSSPLVRSVEVRRNGLPVGDDTEAGSKDAV